MKSLLNILLSILKYSYRQAKNRQAGDFIKQARGKVKGLMMIVMAFTAYSGVTRRPALSARLCCHIASHLLPPHTLDPFSPFHSPFTSQLSPQFPGSFMSLLMLQRTTHLQSLSPARRSHLAQRSSLRWPCIDRGLTFVGYFGRQLQLRCCRKPRLSIHTLISA